MRIRTQDRHASINHDKHDLFVQASGACKWDIRAGLRLLGTYNSLERAIEIMDDIDNTWETESESFVPEGGFNHVSEVNSIQCNLVYEMPNE